MAAAAVTLEPDGREGGTSARGRCTWASPTAKAWLLRQGSLVYTGQGTPGCFSSVPGGGGGLCYSSSWRDVEVGVVSSTTNAQLQVATLPRTHGAGTFHLLPK